MFFWWKILKKFSEFDGLVGCREYTFHFESIHHQQQLNWFVEIQILFQYWKWKQPTITKECFDSTSGLNLYLDVNLNRGSGSLTDLYKFVRHLTEKTQIQNDDEDSSASTGQLAPHDSRMVECSRTRTGKLAAKAKPKPMSSHSSSSSPTSIPIPERSWIRIPKFCTFVNWNVDRSLTKRRRTWDQTSVLYRFHWTTNSLLPSFQFLSLHGKVLISHNLFKFIYHAGSCFNLNFSSQTVFFTAVVPMNTFCLEQREHDLTQLRLLFYKQTWKVHQDAVHWVDFARAQRLGLTFPNKVKGDHSLRHSSASLHWKGGVHEDGKETRCIGTSKSQRLAPTGWS